MNTTAEQSLFQNLWERRFIQYVISYLVGCWGVLQFIDWIVKRYSFSPAWVDILFVFLAAILPSVLVLIYKHGRPGPDRWGRLEKILVPSNLVVAFLLLFFVFSGTSLGATASKVEVTSEEGETIERYVPSKALTKRLVIFPFETPKDQEAEPWTGLAVPFLLGQDLNQSNLLYASLASFRLETKYNDFGYQLTDKLPFSVQREIAEDAYADEFFTGTLTMDAGGNYQLQLQAFETESGELRFEKSLSGPDLFQVIDEASKVIQKESFVEDISKSRLKFVDLPVTNLFTASIPAYKAYQEGMLLTKDGQQIGEAIAKFQEALELDPNFVEAYAEKGKNLVRLNQTEEGRAALEKAVDRMQAISEPQQFMIRYTYYQAQQKVDKAVTVLEMWRQLYPDNFTPYQNLMQLYASQMGNIKKATEVGEAALNQGHGRSVLLQLARLHLIAGQTDQAKAYMEQFAKAYPQKIKETNEIGEIFMREGDFEKAKAHFESVNLMDPNNTRTLRRLAEIHTQLGDFQEAEAYFQEALKESKNAQDSSWVLFQQAQFQQNLGKASYAIKLLKQRWEVLSSVLTKYEIGMEIASYPIMVIFLNAQKKDELLKLKAEFLRDLSDPSGFYKCVAELNFFIAVENKDSLNLIIDGCAELLTTTLGESVTSMVKGYQHKLNGDYEAALTAFQHYFQVNGLDGNSFADLINGEVYYLKGDHKNAILSLEKTLRVEPNNAFALLWYARALLANQQPAEAKKALTRLQTVWKNAEPEFIPFLEMQEEFEMLL